MAGVKNRLPAKDIRWILAQNPEAPPGRFLALKRSNPSLVPRPGEEEDMLYEMQERLPKLQEWVRSELKEKGYVEVEDEWFERTAEQQAWIDRHWPGKPRWLMDGPAAAGLSEGGEESESDSDDEDGEDDLDFWSR